jgi:tRNA(fMet)-specific endonuclease VapC
VSQVLDANAFIHHMRHGPASSVTARMLAAPTGSVFLCSVVLSELLYGVARSNAAHRPKHRAQVAGLRAQFPCLPFDDAAAEDHALIRAHLAVAGTPIGPNDMMIAAIARCRGFSVVTHNTAEFGRVPGLLVEDWQ